jgi:hypothetical protein
MSLPLSLHGIIDGRASAVIFLYIAELHYSTVVSLLCPNRSNSRAFSQFRTAKAYLAMKYFPSILAASGTVLSRLTRFWWIFYEVLCILGLARRDFLLSSR